MKFKTTSEDASLLALVFTLIGIHAVRGQSPCPDIFTYRKLPNTNKMFGLIEINNIPAGQVIKLNISLAITAQLPMDNFGSITLFKTNEAAFDDIVNGNPLQYRVNFPLQNPLATVLHIALNDQTICTGPSPQGFFITFISLHHTFYTQKSYNPQTPPIRFTQPVSTPPVTHPSSTMRTTIAPAAFSARHTCGKSYFLNRLSFNGELVGKGQFPWIVPLFDRAQASKPKYICGSTIISNKHLITVAHCIYNFDDFIPADQILAIPGMYHIDDFSDENAEFAYIDSIHPHENYFHDDDLNESDIAILKMKKVLIFSHHIVPICLWNGADDLKQIVDQQGFAAGWGLTEKGPTSVPTYIKATIVSRQSCRDNLDRVFPHNSHVFCGDGNGTAPCNGDSGNGFVMKRGNQYFLRGIVSKGRQDPITLKCDVNKFAIYTDVALFRYWIKDIMSQ